MMVGVIGASKSADTLNDGQARSEHDGGLHIKKCSDPITADLGNVARCSPLTSVLNYHF
jgi:hypothetical protein